VLEPFFSQTGTVIDAMAGKFTVYHGFNGSGGGVLTNAYGIFVNSEVLDS